MEAAVRRADPPEPDAFPTPIVPPHRAGERLTLACDGTHRIAVLVNRRWLRVQCRQQRCRHAEDPEGKRFTVYHVFDLARAGLRMADEYEAKRS